MYISITEKAKQLRKRFKELGYPAKSISVRSGYCTYSDDLNITIKDIHIPLDVVRREAEKFEDISYDQASGEILSGGNTYVFCQYSGEALNEAAKPYLEEAKKIMADGEGKPSIKVRSGETASVWYFDANDLCRRHMCIIGNGSRLYTYQNKSDVFDENDIAKCLAMYDIYGKLAL